MKINNKMFKVILLMVAILVTTGYGLVYYFKMDEPVFFHHYYDRRVSVDGNPFEQIYFNLSYITDAYDDSVVVDIQFPEQPELTIAASEYNSMGNFIYGGAQNNIPGEIYGRYSVRNIYCKIIHLPEGKALDGAVLTQPRILFDDYREMSVDIGEIHLYEHMTGRRCLENAFASCSSDGTAKTRCTLLEDVTITAIESPLMETLKDTVQWEINGSDPYAVVGTTFQKGNFLDVTSKVNHGDTIISKYTLFDVQPKLIFTGDDGTSYSYRFFNIDNPHPYYSFTKLYQYIKARESM